MKDIRFFAAMTALSIVLGILVGMVINSFKWPSTPGQYSVTTGAGNVYHTDLVTFTNGLAIFSSGGKKYMVQGPIVVKEN